MAGRIGPNMRFFTRGWRWIALAALVVALVPAQIPRVVVAADATVATCDEASFDTALATVQESGSGTITFSCSGTITFNSEKTVSANVTVDGGGSVTLDGGNSTSLFDVESTAVLSLYDLALQNGATTSNGGAILNLGTLNVIDSVFSNNTASGPSSLGGAIDNVFGSVTVLASTFTSNSAASGGGAINNSGSGDLTVIASSFSTNSSRQGGAIQVFGGTATITASDFTGNSAGAFGNAIENQGTTTITASTFSNNISADVFGGAIDNGATLTVTNSTFNGNAAGDGIGGAIYSGSSNMLTVTASTFASNSASAGGAMYSRGTLNISGSIVANNTATTSGNNCTISGGTITSQGSNLSNDATCGLTAAGDVQDSATVSLGGLADNGGPTQTMMPQSGSAAIDAADCTFSTAADQRGAARPTSNCDIGAVETGAKVPVQILAATQANNPTLEGQTAIVHVAASGPTGISYDHDFDCDNDGTFENQGSGASTTGSASCAFAEDGSYTVGVQSCNAVGSNDCGTGMATVTVANGNPNISSVTNDGPVDAGNSVKITVTATDPGGANDPLKFEFDCDNDGTYEIVPQAGTSASCLFADPGVFEVPVRVTDDDGGMSTGSTSVAVNSIDPTITDVTNDGPTGEGSPATITVLADPPAGNDDPLMYEFDCDDDGLYEIGTQSENSADCIFGDNGSFTVAVRVTNASGGSATGSTNVTVNNVAPTITSVENFGPINEGGSTEIRITASDPAGVNDHLRYEFDCDNDGAYELGPAIQSFNACSFDDNGDFTVNVRVSDEDGGLTTGGTVVSVNNLDPSITDVTNDGPISEGGSTTIAVTATDPAGDNDPLLYAFDCDNDGGYEVQPGLSSIATCTFSDDGNFTVGVQVTDDDGGTATSNTNVTVINVAPVIHEISASGPAVQGQPVTIIVEASDVAGMHDPLTYSFDCDNDGNFETAGNLNVGICSLNPATANTTIGVQVSDDDLGLTTASIEVGQTLTVCGNFWTGVITLPDSGGACGRSSVPLLVPSDTSTMICIDLFTEAMRWSPNGDCAGSQRPHLVPESGPLPFCNSLWTGKLRANLGSGPCGSYELPGVIPG